MGHAKSHANNGQVMAVCIPIQDKATRYKGGSADRNDDGSGNGLGIGQAGDPSPTITSGDRHAIALDLRNALRDPDKHDEINRQGAGIGDDVAHTLSAGAVHGVASFKTGQSADSRSIGYQEDIAPSLEGGGGGNNKPAIMADMAVRRLTPRECERLQGFPDDYTLLPGKTADGPRYKALGNSMAVPVMRWLGERIEKIDSIIGRAK